MDTPSNAIEEALDELPLANLPKSGKAPKERLKNPSALRDIFTRMRDDDRTSAYSRSLQQALREGEPPYNQEALEESGQSDTTNLNFQGAEQRCERAKAPYYRLIHGSDTLLKVRTLHGAEDERPYWEEVISEEISRMIRRWDKFPYESEHLVDKHVWDGLGLVFWADDRDWRFTSGGLGQFFFPRQAKATECDQTIICRYDEYSVPELYRKIEDEEDAAENGWDVKAVKEAIRKATSKDPDWQDWEFLMKELKNNDISSATKAPVIRVIHGLVEEFDGKVSHYMTTEDDCDSKDFMFKSRSVYEKMTEALVMFPYSTGTNHTIHGIRGLGYKVYAFEQQRNRSIGRLIDKGFEASSLMLQAADESSLLNSGLEYMGNLAILQPGFNVVQTPMADLQRSVVPALELMERLGNERTAAYSTENVFDGDQRKTKFEIAAHLDQSASLNDSALDFFYGPWRRVLQQIVRRVSRKDYHRLDPGGREVEALRQRLERREVPLEALYKLDHEETLEVRVIGAGSAAAKTMSLERMSAIYPRMDDVGKANFDYDLAVDNVGASNAERYFPRQPGIRTSADTQIAINQNFILLNGGECPVLSSDRHLAHSREHLKPLMEMYQAVEGGQMDQAEAAVQFIPLFEHAVQHVDQVAGDEGSIEEANMQRQMLQRIGEVISNGIKEAEARAEEAAQAEAEGQQQAAEQGQGGPTPEQMERFAKAQAEIEIMQQKAAVEQQIKLQNAEVERGIKDADMAAKIRRENMKEGM